MKGRSRGTGPEDIVVEERRGMAVHLLVETSLACQQSSMDHAGLVQALRFACTIRQVVDMMPAVVPVDRRSIPDASLGHMDPEASTALVPVFPSPVGDKEVKRMVASANFAYHAGSSKSEKVLDPASCLPRV